MPRWSDERKALLYTKEECAVLLKTSIATVKRAAGGTHVYKEKHYLEREGRGRTPRTFFDPLTLGLPLPKTEGEGEPMKGSLAQFSGSRLLDLNQSTSEASQRAKLSINPLPAGEFSGSLRLSQRTVEFGPVKTPESPADALALHQRLQPVLNTKRNSCHRSTAVEALAAEMGVSIKTVYRWLTALEKQANSPYAIARQQRADKGRLRIPAEARELITAAYLNNKPEVSASAIHRVLERSAPELMLYTTKSGTSKRIEPWTVLAVERELRADPVMQLIFKDGKERKEFLRVYNGKVRALHANAQWEMDMTRCDVEVFNPLTKRFYRLRIHAIIDVYSTCVMGLAFSEDEDQTQTNIALLRALTPKVGRYEHMYPMWGTPNSIYWDNGKTYSSKEVDRITETLGIVSIHSTPRTSHTRGAIERFFGTLHGMIEKALAGYVGMNAVSRDSEELRHLRERTLKWADTGIDPGLNRRHYTEEEFKSVVALWLLREYHQMRGNDGLTRQERYLDSIRTPEGKSTLKHYDPWWLYLTFCKWEKRVVTPDGGIQYSNRLLKSPEAVLAGYAGREVVLLLDSFSTEGWFGVLHKNIDGTYRVLGEVEAAPEWADLAESAMYRKTEKAARKGLQNDFQKRLHASQRTELTVAGSLLKELPAPDSSELPVIDVPAPTVRARLSTEARQDDVADFGFTRKFADTQTPEELMAVLDDMLPRRKK